MMSWHNYELPDNSVFPPQYLLQAVIHEGVNSVLLLAQDTASGSLVAIKCFRASAKGSYLREVGAVFDIQHPHLIRCLDTFYRSDGIACIVYEHLSGGSLAELLAKQGHLPLPDMLACLRAMLKVLRYLHSLNFIHCDIKPENILLRPVAGGTFEYVLIDLGAACSLREAREGLHVTGTPAYIAPERIKNRFFFNSDLYSLGVIAYEMATGTRPFTGTVAELTDANLSEVPSLTAIKAPELRDFIDFLLVKNPLQRIASAALALAMLERIESGIKVISQTLNPGKQDDNVVLVLNSPEKLLGIYGFHAHGSAIIGLRFAHHVELLQPLASDIAKRTLFTDLPLQVLANDSLAYATASRLQTLNLSDGSECLIKERLSDVKGWHVESGGCLWSNVYYHFYEPKLGGPIQKFVIPNYWLTTEKHIFPDGYLVGSEGIANNKVVLRDRQTAVLQEWLLDDPVIALSHANGNVLAVTIDLSASSRFTAWCLTVAQGIKTWLLPADVEQVRCLNGRIFWLAKKNTLYCCDSSLQPQRLKQFASSVENYAVSFDGQLIVASVTNADGKLILTITKLSGML